MSNEVSLIASIVVGAISLYVLLTLIRQLLPTLFVPETKQLNKVIKVQSTLRQTFTEEGNDGPSETLLKSIKETASVKRRDGKLTVAKRLKYARWPISPLLFHLFSFSLSGLFLSLTLPYTNFVIHIITVLSGPIIMRGILMYFVERRCNRFDTDYPQFLMSMVGLLKTGMTASSALETAARGLDSTSLVREEVVLMLERVRVGVLEDKSIGSFGEDIYHPEIELFVQALLLSRRMGGNLSESLERLSKQVRKRQYFKSAATAAVGLQRGSLLIIIGLLVALQGYIAIVYPALILKGMQTALGWQIWQICFALIVIAFFWARQVTRMKI